MLEGHRYRLDFNTPPGKLIQRNVPRGRVLHAMWSECPREPWRGMSPLEVATGLGKLVARTEKKLGEDVNTPVAHLIAIPVDGGATNLDQLRSDIGNAQGGGVLVQSTYSGFAEDKAAGTRGDWTGRRLGPMVPTELRVLYSDVLAAVAQACGIPNSLVASDNVDGTEVREAYRRFVLTSVQPVADLIAADVSDALDTEVRLTFHGLWAHDLVGRANALDKLVSAGVDLADARRLVGLE